WRRGWGAGSGRATHGKGGGPTSDLRGERGEHAVHGQGPRVLAAAPPDARRAVLRFALAHDQHVRHLPELGLADPVAELLVAVVELHPDARLAEALEEPAPVLGVLLA